MKKAVSLILALVLCLSLCACGGGNDTHETTNAPTTESSDNSSNAEKAVLGAWIIDGEYDAFVFSEDGKVVVRETEEYDWWYDKEAERYSISFYGLTYTFVIEEDETGRYFDVDGERLYYVENYDPEAMEAEKITSIIEGKTELVVGKNYTTDDGVEFVFEKAELRESKSPWGDEILGSFTLYITYESELSISDEKYTTSGRNSSFGLGNQPQWKEGNTYCFSGGFEEMADLEADKDGDFGILSFTINGTAYYIRIETFFE